MRHALLQSGGSSSTGWACDKWPWSKGAPLGWGTFLRGQVVEYPTLGYSALLLTHKLHASSSRHLRAQCSRPAAPREQLCGPRAARHAQPPPILQQQRVAAVLGGDAGGAGVDTVSAKHDLGTYLSLLKTNGAPCSRSNRRSGLR